MYVIACSTPFQCTSTQHLSLAEAPAGVTSARQTISQEPSFTRKRKVHDSDSQTVQECVLHHGREDTDTNNEVCTYTQHAYQTL